jgi:hypothetical protein
MVGIMALTVEEGVEAIELVATKCVEHEFHTVEQQQQFYQRLALRFAARSAAVRGEPHVLPISIQPNRSPI